MLRATIKGLLAQRVRLLLTALAVVLGVGFLTATLVLSDSIRQGVDEVFGGTAVNSDAEVRSAPAFSAATGPDAPREPLPESIVERIKVVDGVDEVAGLVQGYAQLLDGDGDKVGSLTTATVGGSAAGIGTVSPFELASGRAPQGGDEVVLDVATARSNGLGVGEEVTILFTGPARTFRIVGTVTFGGKEDVGGATYALFDLATAQEVLDRQGRLDDVLVSGEEGVSPTELVQRLQAALPDTVEVTTSEVRAEERSDTTRQGLSIVNTGLTAFAVISLAVGSFIILNTFTIVIAQRTRELALLRALGASRRQVRRSVLLEAAVVGLVASAVGTGVGVGLATGLRSLIESFGLGLPGSGVVVHARSLWLPVLVGLVVTSTAAYLPARRAGGLAPLAAIREMSAPPRGVRRRSVVGAVLLVVGLLLGFLGVPLVLVGVALLAPLIVPRLAAVVGSPARGFGAVQGRLGLQNAVRNPRRTASTASALMVGLGLVVAVAVVADSALSSFGSALDQSVKADYIVDSASSTLSPELGRRLADRPELASVSPMRFGDFELVGDPAVEGTAGDRGQQSVTAVDGRTFGTVMDLGVSEGGLAALVDGGVLVSETKARDNGWEVGETITMKFAKTGAQVLTIDGTYAEDTLEDQGFILSLKDFEANYTDQRDQRVLVTVAPGTTAGAARAAIEEVTAQFPNARVEDRAGYKAQAKSQIDTIVALVAVLLGLAVIIAVLGIVNTLALSIVERTRELGLLRAVGMSRRQLRAMIRWESVIIAVVGAVLGLAVGMQVGSTLAGALGDFIQSVTYPWVRLGLFVVFGVLAGMAAAVLPARRAAKLDVLTAVRHQ